jgi:hypothetical protein
MQPDKNLYRKALEKRLDQGGSNMIIYLHLYLPLLEKSLLVTHQKSK